MLELFDSRIPPPLGGKGLMPLSVPASSRKAALDEAICLPKLKISGRSYGDLVMLGMGGFTPLAGFMTRSCWESVCEKFILPDGTFWPMPVLLDASPEDLSRLVGGRAALVYQERVVGTITIDDVWEMTEDDCWFEAERVYKGKGKDSRQFRVTALERHPGVRHVFFRHRVFVGGIVTVLEPLFHAESMHQVKDGVAVPSPGAFREYMQKMGWRTVVCMQLRNPPHRSHEYLMRIGLEIADALLIHTPVGALKPGDLPADVRFRAIQALVDEYLPKERVVIAGYPLDMRYAGPREALLHAAFRQNYGITYQIVGRDHAGVADFYEPFESQEIFSHIPTPASLEKALLTRPLKIRWPFYCKKCGTMASLNTCPHGMEHRIFHSGSLLRKHFSEGMYPGEGFIRPEVFECLVEYYRDCGNAQKIALSGAADG